MKATVVTLERYADDSPVKYTKGDIDAVVTWWGGLMPDQAGMLGATVTNPDASLDDTGGAD